MVSDQAPGRKNVLCHSTVGNFEACLLQVLALWGRSYQVFFFCVCVKMVTVSVRACIFITYTCTLYLSVSAPFCLPRCRTVCRPLHVLCAFYAFYAFYAWWIYFPQSGALAEGTSRVSSRFSALSGHCCWFLINYLSPCE